MALSIPPVLLQNLNSLIQTEFGLIWGVPKEMKKLRSTLSAIQAVLEDAEEKQLQSSAIRDWLGKLKIAAYELDDILDDCSTETRRWEYKGQSSGPLKKVTTSLLNCYPVQNILFRHKIGTRMKEITENLDKIADERTKFDLREAVAEKKIKNRETGPDLIQLPLCGRDEDNEKIVKVLVEDVCDSEGLSVYPIVGMGGLGKTTLAQMAFNDERVKSHFEPRIWVYVSQDFDAKRLVRATIESASGKACDVLDLGSLQRRLKELLNGKRYLIALDDVWNEDQEEWDNLKSLLGCGAKGASLIVTTRIEKVAAIMRTVPPHRLSSLSEDDCWLLFRQRAFGPGNEELPNLVAIGKEIVKKCGGVPLAAKALGGLLRFEREEYWLKIKNSEIWNLPQDENSILSVLRLSYYSLPLELRRCFAYCAIFPKGSKIEKEDLIRHWMANGYVSCKEKQELEDVGEDVCNKLRWRSFFQVVDKEEIKKMAITIHNYKMEEIGCMTWFKMHDLVHDLAHSVMEDEHQMMGTESSSNVRCASLRSLRREENQAACIPFKRDKYDFRKFGSLRVVYGGGIEMWKWCSEMRNLPPSIGSLKHLRYLDISASNIKQLPDSICSLWNLQTLILDYCEDLMILPKNMNYLRDLRHLYLAKCPLIEMPPKIGQLTCLKTLTLFVVGESMGCSSLAELQCLNLGGTLRIEHLERVRNPTDAKEANLVEKKNLHLLELSWGRNAAFESQENVEELLEALEPHPNVIKGMIIQNYKGTHLPCWMSNSVLANIVVIELISCNNCSELPPLGQLPLLRRLKITFMDKLKYIDNDFRGEGPVRGFPSLEVLEISFLPNLEGLSREEGRELFPCLGEIKVDWCPKLRFPHLSSPKHLTVNGGLTGCCTNVVLNSISNLSSLTSLRVSGNKEAICFPEEALRNLTLLEKLEISKFSKLKMLPDDVASLIALKELVIKYCRELESLPEGIELFPCLGEIKVEKCPKLRFPRLSSPKSLNVTFGCTNVVLNSISNLSSLTSLRVHENEEAICFPEEVLRNLTLLERLTISKFSKLKMLPDDVASLIALKSLDISNCDEFESLPEEGLLGLASLQTLHIYYCNKLSSLSERLGHLTSLQSLEIEKCPKMVSLPASIQSLTKLQELRITFCGPELKRRCQKETGEDWYKVAHVPHVHISEKYW